MCRQPVTVESSSSLEEAYALMRERGFEGLPVTRGGKLAGVLTLWDVFVAATASKLETGRFLREKRVADVMVADVVAVSEDEILEAAASLLYRHDFDLLPVVDRHDRVTGVIGKGDVFRAFVEFILAGERGFPGTGSLTGVALEPQQRSPEALPLAFAARSVAGKLIAKALQLLLHPNESGQDPLALLPPAFLGLLQLVAQLP
jgi:CBS domain-containing protein